MKKKLPTWVYQLSKAQKATVEKAVRRELKAEGLDAMTIDDAVYDALDSKVSDLPSSVRKKIK